MQRSRSSAIVGEIGIGLSNVRFGNVIRVEPGPYLNVRSWSGHSPPLSQTGQSSGWLTRMNSSVASWPSAAFAEDCAVSHDHPVLGGQGAAGLELGHALDLDQAHAAGADGRAEPRLVTEDRDLDPRGGGRLDEPGALGDLDLPAVDGDLDDLLDRAHP